MSTASQIINEAWKSLSGKHKKEFISLNKVKFATDTGTSIVVSDAVAHFISVILASIDINNPQDLANTISDKKLKNLISTDDVPLYNELIKTIHERCTETVEKINNTSVTALESHTEASSKLPSSTIMAKLKSNTNELSIKELKDLKKSIVKTHKEDEKTYEQIQDNQEKATKLASIIDEISNVEPIVKLDITAQLISIDEFKKLQAGDLIKDEYILTRAVSESTGWPKVSASTDEILTFTQAFIGNLKGSIKELYGELDNTETKTKISDILNDMLADNNIKSSDFIAIKSSEEIPTKLKTDLLDFFTQLSNENDNHLAKIMGEIQQLIHDAKSANLKSFFTPILTEEKLQSIFDEQAREEIVKKLQAINESLTEDKVKDSQKALHKTIESLKAKDLISINEFKKLQANDSIKDQYILIKALLESGDCPQKEMKIPEFTQIFMNNLAENIEALYSRLNDEQTKKKVSDILTKTSGFDEVLIQSLINGQNDIATNNELKKKLLGFYPKLLNNSKIEIKNAFDGEVFLNTVSDEDEKESVTSLFNTDASKTLYKILTNKKQTFETAKANLQNFLEEERRKLEKEQQDLAKKYHYNYKPENFKEITALEEKLAQYITLREAEIARNEAIDDATYKVGYNWLDSIKISSVDEATHIHSVNNNERITVVNNLKIQKLKSNAQNERYKEAIEVSITRILNAEEQEIKNVAQALIKQGVEILLGHLLYALAGVKAMNSKLPETEQLYNFELAKKVIESDAFKMFAYVGSISKHNIVSETELETEAYRKLNEIADSYSKVTSEKEPIKDFAAFQDTADKAFIDRINSVIYNNTDGSSANIDCLRAVNTTESYTAPACALIDELYSKIETASE